MATFTALRARGHMALFTLYAWALTQRRPLTPRRIAWNRGQALVEYGLILVLIAIVVIAALHFLGGAASNTLKTTGNTLSQNT